MSWLPALIIVCKTSYAFLKAPDIGNKQLCKIYNFLVKTVVFQPLWLHRNPSSQWFKVDHLIPQHAETTHAFGKPEEGNPEFLRR